MHERQLDVVALEAAERFGDRFQRTLHVGLQDQVQRGDLARLHLAEDVFEAHAALHPRVAALVERFREECQ